MKQYGVIGLGRFGKAVAKTLAELGNEVVVIDIEESNINEIRDVITHGLIGDSTNKNILTAAGIQEVDAVIIGITDFKTSILTSLLCKELGCKNIIAKARDDVHASILDKLGVDDYVIPEKDMGKKLAHNLSSTNVVDILSLSNDFDIIELELPKSWEGQTIAQLDIRNKYDLNILGIKRGDDFLGNPGAAFALKPNDNLVILGHSEAIANIQEIE